MDKSAISLLLLLATGCMGSVEELNELEAEESSLEQGPNFPICAALPPPSEPMHDDLSFRFDPTLRCPAAEFTATEVPTEQTVGVHVLITPEASTKNDPNARRKAYFPRTTYTIRGKTVIMVPGRFGPRWIESWQVLAQGTRDGTNSFSHTVSDEYVDIKVALRSDEIQQFCVPHLRQTPDGGWIPTGEEDCTPETVTGRLGATVDFVYDYVNTYPD